MSRSHSNKGAGTKQGRSQNGKGKLLTEQGYDGIQILDDRRQETVIFPASLAKVSLTPVITTAPGA